jgi:pimeloyl-ACP methyl ester carboxylesterase
MSKIPVYFMPGLAASPLIFERIKLPDNAFEMFFLEWILPVKGESLLDYVKRLTVQIKHPNPVLIGVSFGGIIVQEMAKIISVRKTIIISSVKSNTEFPRRMKFAKTTKVYKLLPTSWVKNFENLAKFAFGKPVVHRLELYKMYLSVRDPFYLAWALEQIVMWKQCECDPNVIHIHGDNDDVFPIKYIHNCSVVKGGTHIMILNKYKWFNENLPKIILEE